MAYTVGVVITGISSIALLALGIAIEVNPLWYIFLGRRILSFMFIPVRYFNKVLGNTTSEPHIDTSTKQTELNAAKAFGVYFILCGLFILFLFVGLLISK